MKKIYVQIDNYLLPRPAFVHPEEHWNGWLIPYFYKSDASDIVTIVNRDSIQTAEWIEVFNEEKDCVELVSLVCDEKYPLTTTIIDGVKYYNVGSGWCWDMDCEL